MGRYVSIACVTLLRFLIISSLLCVDKNTFNPLHISGIACIIGAVMSFALYLNIALGDPGFLKSCPSQYVSKVFKSPPTPPEKAAPVIDFDKVFETDSFFDSDDDEDERLSWETSSIPPNDDHLSPEILGNHTGLEAPAAATDTGHFESFSRYPDGVYQSGHKLYYCAVCKMYMPLRCKHCNECGRCVRTFDHHCPWMGLCIGERNRCTFMAYLIAEAFELSMALTVSVINLISLKDSPILSGGAHTRLAKTDYSLLAAQRATTLMKIMLAVIVCAVMIAFIMMVLCLLSYHVGLAGSNLTTWEDMAAQRVSYMKGARVSPFSQGVLKNLTVYCCSVGTLTKFLGERTTGYRRFWCFGKDKEIIWTPEDRRKGYQAVENP
eukprot:GHVO01068911.1.p1 GENE.GHVO01068911.1~~GHVO01068911.1.p1  ORF type:complete len:390 (-),score=62.55 GHVO01068911.1:183-1322(-)